MGFLSRSRKSSASGNTVYSPATSTAGDSTTTVDSLSSRIIKTFTFGHQRSSDGNSNSNTSKFPAPTSAAPAPQTPKKKKQPKKVRHPPSERQLTEANLRHYEMLSEFRMEFGRTRSRTSFDSDISPMGSRMGSFDYGSQVGPFGERS